jgi:hypothetical protein
MKSAVSLLALIALAHCAPRATGEAIDREHLFTVWSRKDVSHFTAVLPSAVDSVWRIVPVAFQSLHFPGAPSVYPEERVYLTPYLKVERHLYEGEANSEYLNCGFTQVGERVADVYRVTFAMIARLVAHSTGGTDIDIIIDGSAQNMVERQAPVRCTGTGKLEALVFQTLQDSLRTHH